MNPSCELIFKIGDEVIVISRANAGVYGVVEHQIKITEQINTSIGCYSNNLTRSQTITFSKGLKKFIQSSHYGGRREGMVDPSHTIVQDNTTKYTNYSPVPSHPLAQYQPGILLVFHFILLIDLERLQFMVWQSAVKTSHFSAATPAALVCYTHMVLSFGQE
ncbi:12009_t:CDS:2 [Entrophospora sp. SA101]|nr:12007_t:CDS:2 [Entrophospora sp. SA101]CAJ0838549.1 12009_t:CDS:2 [Entrophospora sp. SA101]